MHTEIFCVLEMKRLYTLLVLYFEEMSFMYIRLHFMTFIIILYNYLHCYINDLLECDNAYSL